MSKKKVVLEYDEKMGQLYDADGDLVGTWHGVVSFPERESKSEDRGTVSADDLETLKKAGYDADDIVLLRKKGLI